MIKRKKDIYSKLARRNDLRSRAYFKIKELDEKYRLFHPNCNQRVLEIGCWPGGWSKYIVERCSELIGIDFKKPIPLEGAEFLEGDFRTFTFDKPFNVIVSDACNNFTGIRMFDYRTNLDLCIDIVSFSFKHLKSNGVLLFKFLHTPLNGQLFTHIKKYFSKFKIQKPNVSRNESSELYVICWGMFK